MADAEPFLYILAKDWRSERPQSSVNTAHCFGM